jgi:hypothetical protein
MDNTIQALKEKNLPLLNFENHVPMLINKTKFNEAMGYKWTTFGFLIKSLYANTLKIKGTLEPDMKINYPYKVEELKAMTSERKFFSSDKLVPTNLRMFLQELFPLKSKFELD